MSTINDGGPMFPIPDREFANGNWIYGHSGASLRDWFAGQAMVGILANQSLLNYVDGLSPQTPTRFVVSAQAYGIADAMLKARGQ